MTNDRKGSAAPSADPAAALFGQPPQQVGLIVADLDVAVANYAEKLGIGPWSVYTYTPADLSTSIYRGEPGAYSLRLALTDGTPQLELIEPLEGASVYREFLSTHGPGVHHLAYLVDSMEVGIRTMTSAGYPVLQLGSGFGLDGDGAFAYFDTWQDFGVTLELRELPRRRRPPERVIGAPVRPADT